MIYRGKKISLFQGKKKNAQHLCHQKETSELYIHTQQYFLLTFIT